jgi:hypothetical protein
MRAAFSKAEIESEITSRFGSAFKLHEKRPAEVISTGIPQIDSFTLGGLPRGAMTEIFCPASSGRTSFMLSALAHATKHEEVCALVDTSNAFDPKSALQAEMNFNRLLWIRCVNNLEHAFKATDLLLQGGGFGLVVLDIGNVAGNDARRIISSWWYRFRRTVENTPTAFVVITADSCVRSCTSLALEMKREADVWSYPGSPYPPRASAPLNFLSPVIRQLTAKIVQPTHANLLGGIQVQIDRQKPVHSRARNAEFSVVVPHL